MDKSSICIFRKFQSARPARGATGYQVPVGAPVKVSIRAPREGRDKRLRQIIKIESGFNPRAPRGARPRPPGSSVGVTTFQSARPARGATAGCVRMSSPPPSFNPRAPRGARPLVLSDHGDLTVFQSARPARGATYAYIAPTRDQGFQSARPARGATQGANQNRPACQFQSARPARGATSRPGVRVASGECFNPRAPRGARRVYSKCMASLDQFQSARPARGATPTGPDGQCQYGVSIRAPREGRDRIRLQADASTYRFNPRAPRGARHGRQSRSQ